MGGTRRGARGRIKEKGKSKIGGKKKSAGTDDGPLGGGGGTVRDQWRSGTDGRKKKPKGIAKKKNRGTSSWKTEGSEAEKCLKSEMEHGTPEVM